MDPIRVAAVLVMLTGASLSDLRTRSVLKVYWWPFVAIAAALWVRDLLDGTGPAGTAALAAAGASLFAYVAHQAGLFGAADWKAIATTAWLWPDLGPLLAARTVPALDMLVNASVFVLVLPLTYLVVNLLRGRIAGAATALAVPMPIDEAEKRHVWPMERVGPNGVRRILMQRPGTPLEAVYTSLRSHGVKEVWATPKVPLMVPLLGGAALAAWQGNLMLRLLL